MSNSVKHTRCSLFYQLQVVQDGAPCVHIHFHVFKIGIQNWDQTRKDSFLCKRIESAYKTYSIWFLGGQNRGEHVVLQAELAMTFPLIIVSMLIKVYSSALVPVPFCAELHPSTTAFPPSWMTKGKEEMIRRQEMYLSSTRMLTRLLLFLPLQISFLK